jgi:superfamily II helicase
MQNRCIDCTETTKLIKFKQDNTIVYICQRCLDEKINKGIKNNISFIGRYKDIKGISRNKQI